MADLASLLTPISEESRAGEDLSYDPGRQEIEQAFESSASGEGEGEQADWRAIIRQILDQSSRTKDVWLAIYLARAGVRSQDLETVELGCQYLAGLFEEYWDSVHPTLDEYGFQGRKGPCESLTRIGEFLGPLRRVPLIVHPRLGSYSGEDLERFTQQGDSADGYGMFRAAIDDLAEDDLRAVVDRLDHIRDAIRRADQVLTQKAEGDTGTNFTATYEAIEAIRRGLVPYTGIEEEAVATDSDPAGSAGVSGVEGSGSRMSGRIESREDVTKALDAVTDYYRRREPGSPVPVLIARAKQWVDMAFLEVLEDIAPDSMSDARRVLQATRDRESNY
jgi:type VI secretion system protein ImpA